jgi:2-polyprenyl-3-methyl-5-hydroxy-6-metoxy-1,4-benzoquinol methylase
MQTTESIIRKNELHYNEIYAQVSLDHVINKARDLNKFFEDTLVTDTSWHGLYQGGFAEALEGKRVLEIGCGDGINALIMASLGADVTAIDISKESERIVEEAAARLNLKNVRGLTGDFADLDFEDQSFDFVVGKALIHHLTHECENAYMRKITRLLKPGGEARFFEPAINNQAIDKIRWMIPVPGRPSLLQKKAYAQWKADDPHPERDNSSTHYFKNGKNYFQEVVIVPIGSLERFCRLMPRGEFNRSYRRWAHRVEVQLPMWFREHAARAQLIVYRRPLKQGYGQGTTS